MEFRRVLFRSVHARAAIRAPFTGEARVESAVRNASISSSLVSPAVISRSSSRPARAAAGWLTWSSWPVKVRLPQVDGHGMVAAPPQVGGGKTDRIARLRARRRDAAGAVVGQRAAAGDRDHLPGMPAHVPRHPGVMVRIPRPHADPAAQVVAHALSSARLRLAHAMPRPSATADL